MKGLVRCACLGIVVAGGLGQEAGRSSFLQQGALSGVVHDNDSNAGRSGSGWNPLRHARYPEVNLYRNGAVGLNFEHIFNGTKADRAISMFTPRRSRCLLSPIDERSASLSWPAADSPWDMDCSLTYTLSGEHCIDIDFRVSPRSQRAPLGFVAFMWASYMGRTRERPIHFLGSSGGEAGWISFGEDTVEGFETGTIAYAGVPPLPYEPDAQTLNLIENEKKRFTEPFYYGLVDGDGNLDSTDDTMVYIMMFDQRESIRFALWNFIKAPDGRPDPHSPAWDWQFVIRDPQPGLSYGYRARVVYKPFVSRADVQAEYENWRKSLGSERGHDDQLSAISYQLSAFSCQQSA